MTRWLVRILGEPAPKPEAIVFAARSEAAKRGASKWKAAERERMLERTRDLRFEMGLPWRI